MDQTTIGYVVIGGYAALLLLSLLTIMFISSIRKKIHEILQVVFLLATKIEERKPKEDNLENIEKLKKLDDIEKSILSKLAEVKKRKEMLRK